MRDQIARLKKRREKVLGRSLDELKLLREIAPDLAIPGVGRVASLPINEAEPAIERIA